MKLKRVLAALLAAVCVFSLFACAADTTSSTSANYTLERSKRAYTVSSCAYCKTVIEECVCDCHHAVNGLMCANCSADCVVAERELILDRYQKWPVNTVGKASFKDCTHIHKVTLSDYVTSIQANAFENCTELTSIVMGDGVVSIESEAFKGCVNLEDVVLGENVTTIKTGAFIGCESIKYIDLSSVTVIEANAFDKTAIGTIILGNSITSIGSKAFDESENAADYYEFFFEGTEDEWIEKCEAIDKNGRYFINQNMGDLIYNMAYYYSETEPTTNGYFWHYVDGKPVIW